MGASLNSMLSVAQDPSFKLVRGYTNEKKNEEEGKRSEKTKNECGSEEESLHRFESEPP